MLFLHKFVRLQNIFCPSSSFYSSMSLKKTHTQKKPGMLRTETEHHAFLSPFIVGFNTYDLPFFGVYPIIPSVPISLHL